jgi:hypothetical protein
MDSAVCHRMITVMSSKRCAIIVGDTVQIPLTRGKVALVDRVDADLATVDWWATASGYAARTERGSGEQAKDSVYLHVAIAKRAGLHIPGREVDHCDLDKMNCRRNNLRPASSAQNKRNREKHKNNTSGHKGVYWDKVNQKWRAMIGVNGRYIHLGRFEDKGQAAAAYEAAARRYHGEFARLT